MSVLKVVCDSYLNFIRVCGNMNLVLSSQILDCPDNLVRYWPDVTPVDSLFYHMIEKISPEGGTQQDRQTMLTVI